MDESVDVEILQAISTDVEESQFKIILSSQCIKAQAYLTDKLHKQAEQQKQICSFINNGNLKLETEIKLAEHEVKSLLSALSTVKTANVELKKELLIAKERKLNVNERVKNGIKKYKELWLVSKIRYESVPFVQNYLQVKNKTKILQDNIFSLKNEITKINNDINIKEAELLHLDRGHIIEVANFMNNERPKIVQNIYEKNEEIKSLLNIIQELTKGYNIESIIMPKQNTTTLVECNETGSTDSVIESSWPNLSTNTDSTMMLPKLQLQNIDLEILTVKLDQIKKVDSQSSSWKRTESEQVIALEKNPAKKTKSDEMIKDLYVSSYFQTNKITKDNRTVDCKSKNYSENKLIHILEDIKLDKAEAYNIVSKFKQSALQDVNMIKAEVSQKDTSSNTLSQEKKSRPVENEYIEEVDLSQKKFTNILVPPSQFLDSQEGISNSQEQNTTHGDILVAKACFKNNSQEKRVKFDTIVSVRNSGSSFDLEKCQETEIVINDSPSNQLNVSTTSDDYIKIKEIIFKKHNLDLSPQFTYTKKTAVPLRSVTDTVTSKFFNEKNNDNSGDENKKQVMDIDDDLMVEKISSQQEQNEEANISSETENVQITEVQKDTSVAGFLFNHGPEGIPDSLNVSISTTGYEDADSDFPQCIDSSLLLSPKSEVQMPKNSDNNVQVLSQGVPNFLSGIRKTGFSFFGSTSSENTDAAAQNQSNNFTFSFGGNEKKNRGGLFSMFH